MADLQHPLAPNVVIDTSTAEKDPNVPNGWNYLATVGGSTVPLPTMQINPADLATGIADSSSSVYATVGAALQGFAGLEEKQDRGILIETILPAAQRGVSANVLGAGPDLANIALQAAVDVPLNFEQWALSGFEGEMPTERYREEGPPIGGSEFWASGLQAVGDTVRKTQRLAEEHLGSINLPGVGKVGVQSLLTPFAFDLTPDESTKARKYVSLIAQLAFGAPVEGAAIAQLAVQLAKTAGSPTSKAVYEAISEMHRTNPIKAAKYEGVMGAQVGTSMVASLEMLDEVYPDAPPWIKSLVMSGGGILLPLAGATALRTGWDAGLNTWFIKYPLQIVRGTAEAVTPSGSRRAAARGIQAMGGDWRDRKQILGVYEHLRYALTQGRDIDPATRIGYTLPQMARNEVTVLKAELQETLGTDNLPTEAEINAAIDLKAKLQEAQGTNNPPTQDEIDAATYQVQRLKRLAHISDLIPKLTTLANFQEGQLQTISEGTAIGAQVYAQYSEEMLKRRDLIFESLDEAVLKLDLGGKPSEDVAPALIEADYIAGAATGSYEYSENIRRAIAEGRGGTLTPEQTEAISQAYNKLANNLDTAKEGILSDLRSRVELFRNTLPEDMTTEQRTLFNEHVQREVQTSYEEMDFYEDTIWNTIKGLDRRKTKSYVSPDGEDLGPQVLIDGVPVGEYFAGKVASLKAGERENQSKWLWKLAGSAALRKQAAKGTGADAQKISRQTLEVETAQRLLVRQQNILDRATQALDELPEIVPGSTQEKEFNRRKKAFENATDNVTAAELRVENAQGKLDIFLGKGVTHEGTEVNLSHEILDTSELGVKMVNDVPQGRSAQEVQNVISHLKQELRYEQSRGSLKNSRKVMAIGEMIDELQNAIGDSENFNVDTTQLAAARSVTDLKKDIFEKGSMGRLRGFSRDGRSIVEPEKVINLIAPTSQVTGKQLVALRELQNALTPITTGENTPFRITGVLDENGKPVIELDLNFNLEKYAEAPPLPFEAIKVGGTGRRQGYRVIEGTPVTEQNIAVVREALWDRFKIFGTGPEFSAPAAEMWIRKNKDALEWLKNATGGKDTGFENLVSAERVVKSLENATANNINRTVDQLHAAGVFNDDFTEAGFRFLIKDAARIDSNIASAAVFLDSPDPLTLGQNFINGYLGSSRPAEFLRETLKVLEKGALSDGSNPAVLGLKQAVAEEIIRRGLTTRGGGSQTSQVASKLSESLNYDVTLWDPDALIGMAYNAKFQRLLASLYGDHAPELFRKIAEGARDQTFISKAALRGVKIQDKFSGEVAGNFGRMIGGALSKNVLIPVSSLVMTGLGKRYGQSTVENIRGLAAEKLLVDFLMNPRLGIAAATEFPLISPTEDLHIRDRLKLWAHYNFIGRNADRLKRIGQAPGILYELAEPTKYEDIQSQPTKYEGIPALHELAEPPDASPEPPPRESELPPGDMEDIIGLPLAPLTGAPPVSGSSLAQVHPIGALGNRASPDPERTRSTLTGLREFGLPLFQAKKGGLASLRKKSRQLVH